MRQSYYVSIQAKTILPQQGDAAYEFEIEAAPEDIQKLNELFGELEDFELRNFHRSYLPGIPYHHDSENDGYDYYLKEVYNMVYRLGTKETKDHIATMKL